MATMIWSLNIALHSCDISPEAIIGKGFKIYHSVGIVIGNVRIGENLKIFQNVTIGSAVNNREKMIGDNVCLFSGCCVLNKIGDNVVVGANSVVLDEFPSNVTIAGIPAKIIKTKKAKLLNKAHIKKMGSLQQGM
ncbi:MAG: serine acetyltransferase [Clostridiaceae bacterium]|nr:serine acetyltransferase [Clostridiaceae bacterium]